MLRPTPCAATDWRTAIRSASRLASPLVAFPPHLAPLSTSPVSARNVSSPCVPVRACWQSSRRRHVRHFRLVTKFGTRVTVMRIAVTQLRFRLQRRLRGPLQVQLFLGCVSRSTTAPVHRHVALGCSTDILPSHAIQPGGKGVWRGKGHRWVRCSRAVTAVAAAATAERALSGGSVGEHGALRFAAPACGLRRAHAGDVSGRCAAGAAGTKAC